MAQMQRSLALTPAYGRTYRGRDAALADWHNGLDFTVHNAGVAGTYCSIRDASFLHKIGFTHLTFHDSNGRTLVNVPLDY
jgi:hypothetical protein